MQLQDADLLGEAIDAAEDLLDELPTSSTTAEDWMALRGLFPIAGRWRAFLECCAKHPGNATWVAKHRLDYEGLERFLVTRQASLRGLREEPRPVLGWRSLVVTSLQLEWIPNTDQPPAASKPFAALSDGAVILQLGRVAVLLAGDSMRRLDAPTGAWDSEEALCVSTSQDFKIKSLDLWVRHEETLTLERQEVSGVPGGSWSGEYVTKQWRLPPLDSKTKAPTTLLTPNSSLEFLVRYAVRCSLPEEPRQTGLLAHVH